MFIAIEHRASSMTSSKDEIDLDPQDWEEFKQIGYEMIDLLVEYHRTVRDRPVWQPIPDEVKQNYHQPLPEEGSDLRTTFEDFKTQVLPYPTGNIHPRFWGWVHGTGTSSGALAELLAAMMNPNTGGREHGANYVEQQVIAWLCEILDFDRQASGLLTSGCSMANLTGLAVARQMKAPGNVRQSGLQSIDMQLLVYGSMEMHSSIQKALEVLGMGSNSLRKIATNDNYEIDLAKLEATIKADLKAGHHPIAIVGNAGTVNSGAIDDFNGLADIAEKYDLWFHIDGAFGAYANMIEEYNEEMAGYNRADSVAFDLHKWMYLPYEIGCILVRDADAHRSTFSLRPDYLAQQSRGLASFNKWPTEYGVELSRGFRALKAWMSFKEHGVSKLREVIYKNIKQARYLGELVSASDKLELMAPVSLNVICFRYHPKDATAEQIEKLNKEILLRVQESGIAVFSSTQLNGTYTLRAAITNQRSRFDDFDLLVRSVERIGDEVANDLLD